MSRLLEVLHTNHTSEPGGAELALARLVHQSDNLWNAQIVLPQKSKSEDVFPGGTPVHNVGPQQIAGVTRTNGKKAILRTAPALAGQAFHLRKFIRDRRPDLVHANSTRAGLYTAMAARKRLPLVLHLRDLVTRESLGSFGFRAFSQIALPAATAVIANSQTTLETARPFLKPTTLCEVIPSPIGIPNRPSSVNTRNAVEDIGMVARIADWKGQDLLIRAFAKLFRETNVKLHFFGGTSFDTDDQLMRLIRQSESLGIRAQTYFHGHVQDIQRAISSLDICVHASTRPEPMGQNILQYLALGKPIVASNEGGPAEMLNHGKDALLFDVSVQGELEESLQRLTQSRLLRANLSENALLRDVPDDSAIAGMHSKVFEAAYQIFNS